MGYLRGADNDLSNFSKFVQKADTILKKLRVSSSKMKGHAEGDRSEEQEIDDGDADEKRNNNESSLISNRYVNGWTVDWFDC